VDYAPDDKDAEAARIRWIEEDLRDNKMCPKGYEITDRKVVVRGHAVLGDLHDIYYYGKCKG